MPPADAHDQTRTQTVRPAGDPERAALFEELAILGRALIQAEQRVADADAAIVAQTRTATNLRKENAQLVLGQAQARQEDGQVSQPDRAAMTPVARLRELEAQAERLGLAVSEKERARFALQEEVWALTEALAGYERLADVPESGASENERGQTSQVTAEIVRLSQLVREQQREMHDSVERADRFALLLNEARSEHSPETDPTMLTALRAGMTRVVAERDHARLLANTAADFPALGTPQRGYVFMFAYGLSGDIALQGLLNRIDGVDIRGENGGAIAPLSEAWTLVAQGGVGNAEAFAEMNRLGWHLANGFASAVLAPQAGCRFSGFREIRWPEEQGAFDDLLDFMSGFFPNARFVFHSRLPAEVAGLGWWAEQPSETVVEMLERRCALFDAAAQARPDTVVRLRYEDYADDLTALAPLFDLVEAPFDANLARAWWQEQVR